MARRDHYQHCTDRRGTIGCGTHNPDCIKRAIPAEIRTVKVEDYTQDGVAMTRSVTIWTPNPEWKKHRGNQCPLCANYYAGRMNEAYHQTAESKKRDEEISKANRPKDFFLKKLPWKKPGGRPQQPSADR